MFTNCQLGTREFSKRPGRDQKCNTVRSCQANGEILCAFDATEPVGPGCPASAISCFIDIGCFSPDFYWRESTESARYSDGAKQQADIANRESGCMGLNDFLFMVRVRTSKVKHSSNTSFP